MSLGQNVGGLFSLEKKNTYSVEVGRYVGLWRWVEVVECAFCRDCRTGSASCRTLCKREVVEGLWKFSAFLRLFDVACQATEPVFFSFWGFSVFLRLAALFSEIFLGLRNAAGA